MLRHLNRAIAVAALAALAACSSSDERPYVERPVEDLYNNAVDALQDRDWRESAAMFDEVERQHPYSVWATKAQLMAAYAHYQANRYDDALLALDRFIQLHPGNRDIAYAYYLKALCHYEQISDVVRDQSATRRAMEALQEVARRFPDTDYARDARVKIDMTRDHLAGKEMAIGRYYLRRGHHLAAINRFKAVVDNYQTTTHAPEALHRLVESYTQLGLTDAAERAAAVLGHNYPGSEWYADSYYVATGEDVRPPEQRRGFLGRAWSSLF